jgi:hypothetical protein
MGIFPASEAASQFSQPSTSNLTVQQIILISMKNTRSAARIITLSLNEYEERSAKEYARSVFAEERRAFGSAMGCGAGIGIIVIGSKRGSSPTVREGFLRLRY